MKRNIWIALVLLILFVSISPVWANRPQRTLAQSNDEIKFRGTAIEYTELVGYAGWTVEVDEVIFGPPISGQVDVGVQSYPPWGYMDPTIEEGDKVEAFGLYYASQNYVSLNGSDYYIVKVEENPRVKFRATALHDEEEGYNEWGNYFLDVRVDEVLEDPQGDLGEYATVYYQDQHSFSTGDCLEVYGTFLESIDVAVGGPYGSPGDYIEECDEPPTPTWTPTRTATPTSVSYVQHNGESFPKSET